MVKATSILMAGITFTGGLLLGFILHLPGASSPHSRHPRSLAEPGHPTGSVVNLAPPVAVVMETDDVNMRGTPVISSRSLLYLSINPESGESLGSDSIGAANDSEQSRPDASQLEVGGNHARRHFNGNSRRRGGGHNPRGIYLEKKSSGKSYTSFPRVNLNSQQANSSSDKAASAYKKVSIDTYNNNRKIINKPSIAQITDYDKKNSNQKNELKATKNTEQYTPPVENVQKQKQQGLKDSVVVGKRTNIDQNHEQKGPSTRPQGKVTQSSDIHGKQVNSDDSVKMSVTVIDIAPGHEEASSDTTLGSSSNIPPRDLITGDDTKSLANAKLNSQRDTSDHHQHMDINGSSLSSSSSGRFGQQLLDLVNGIYWSPQLEDLTPKGFSNIQTDKWRHQALNGRVKELKEGCGRMQNRLVVFEDGSKMCARYRINTDQIQGEVYSYYLAQVLGIQNVPPAVLAKADPSSSQWQGVVRDIDSAQWSPQKLLVLTPWMGNLQPVYIPKELQSEQPEVTSTSQSLVSRNLDELTELVQWSDLILLDYLTANVDRMVNNMFNKQWNPSMMSAPTHNLERVGQAGPIVFLDNESGLLHSYRLLDKYSEYHEKLLRGLCVFRKSTVQQIKRLYQGGTISQELKELFHSQEPELAKGLSFLPHHSLNVLNQRLSQVYRQILSCERLYGSNTNS